MKKKKKYHVKRIIVIILFLYLIFISGYYLLKKKIKNIYILNTTYINDLDIINAANLKDYPSIVKINKSKAEKNIKKLDLVNDVKIKKSIFGKVTIEIDEAKPLFYSRSDNLVYLSNNKTTNNNDKFLGLPILINYVPKDILKGFIEQLKNIDENILKMISEIEYSLEEKDGTIIDEERFVLRMNDTNTVYVNTVNLKRLNEYKKICATMNEGVKGYIYLNSNRETISVTPYDAVKKEEIKNEE